MPKSLMARIKQTHRYSGGYAPRKTLPKVVYPRQNLPQPTAAEKKERKLDAQRAAKIATQNDWKARWAQMQPGQKVFKSGPYYHSSKKYGLCKMAIEEHQMERFEYVRLPQSGEEALYCKFVLEPVYVTLWQEHLTLHEGTIYLSVTKEWREKHPGTKLIFALFVPTRLILCPPTNCAQPPFAQSKDYWKNWRTKIRCG